MGSSEAVHYVIVVHGIGEQRKNESVIAVVNRFAEARRLNHAATSDCEVTQGQNSLTLGKATGQTGKSRAAGSCRYQPPLDKFQPWLEFDGIPADAQAHVHGSFLAELPDRDKLGTNIRFVDMWWADVMQDDFPDVGQDVEAWTEGLRGRLENKHRDHGDDPNRRPPAWALKTVELIQKTAVLLRQLLSLKSQGLEGMIFNDFLGDVQLYGEYAHCRGRAAARFHENMMRIEAAHAVENEEREKRGLARRTPCYHVISHSLGTVMSMDALLYAHADKRIRDCTLNPDVRNLPFRGYEPKVEELREDADTWILRVASFVTLGSPIDKYLTLWWQGYKYLNADPKDWIDERFLERPRIRHYNYCEEQDPVGHNLDLAGTAVGFTHVFETMEDIVYIRDEVPGAAHMAYWRDLDLFNRIMSATVDAPLKAAEVVPPAEETGPGKPYVPGGSARKTPVAWFLPAVFDKILFITYSLVPAAVAVLDFAAFAWMWSSDSLSSLLLGAAAFLVATYLGARFLDLSVMWRQISRLKRGDNLAIWGVAPDEVNGKAQRFIRKVRSKIWVYSLTACLGGFAYAFFWCQSFPYYRLTMIALVLGILLLIIRKLVANTGVETHAEHLVDRKCLLPLVWVVAATIAGLAVSRVTTADSTVFEQLEQAEVISEFFQTDVDGDEGIEVKDRIQPLVFYFTTFFCIMAVVASYRRLRFMAVKKALMNVDGLPTDPKLDFALYGE